MCDDEDEDGDDCDDPTVILEERETDLSPADWWYIGYSDGYSGYPERPPYNPPQVPDLAREYADGRAAGARERAEDEVRKASLPPAGPDDEIPF
jgi:hypothetical protein